MFMFNVLAGLTGSDIISIALAAIGFGSFVYLIIVTDGFAPGNSSRYQSREEPPRHTSATPKYNNQSPEKMKQIGVRRNGQLKRYRINKYGEIFEE